MSTLPRPTAADESRFWKHVNKTESCWLWTGTSNKSPKSGGGYGLFGLQGKRVTVHRLSWTMHYGSIPAGMFVCHHCDTPQCINPDHLFLGTPADNQRDAVMKGRKMGNPALTAAQVLEIRRLYAAGNIGMRKLAPLFGVSSFTIHAAIRGTRDWSRRIA